MIEKRGEFDFKGKLKQFDRFRRQMPKILGNMARNHFLEGFRKGGGQTNASRGGWKKRKPALSERQARRDQGRAILVKSGNMRADIQVRGLGTDRVVVNVINIPYARYHNFGTQRIPKREFIGKSDVLEKRMIFVINLELKRLEKN